MYFQLNVFEEDNSVGIVRVTNVDDCNKKFVNWDEEVRESWDDFHVLEEHELDNYSIDDFVTWHNDKWVSQIERIFVEIVQPS